MHTLSIDIETYSDYDLKKCGVYKYVESPNFEVLVIAYRIDDGPVQVSGEEVEWMLTEPSYLKTAYNANFERVCLSKHFGIDLPADQWECTMVKASMLGLPMDLDTVARVLDIQEQKDKSGKALIRYFSMPCKPSNANGMRTRNLPEHDAEKWQQFVDYCKQDVRVETAIRDSIKWFNIPENEKRLWVLDQHINDYGIRLDKVFVKNALQIYLDYSEKLMNEAEELTGLDNPNSGAQLKEWLSAAMDQEVTTLNKETLPELLKAADSDVIRRVLDIRQELGKTSIKKYATMLEMVCEDSRIRGLLQFYGANRTGRWAGRGVQVQNLAKNSMKMLEEARELVRRGDLEMVEMLWGQVTDVLSQLIRTALTASPGRKLICSDFKAIEARVIAWLAKETWRIDVFASGGDIYKASASQMFRIPLETIDKSMRQRGKVAELALGYQGGVGALIQMGALDKGLTEEELPGLVSAWRRSSPRIVALWKDVETAAIEAVQNGIETSTRCGRVRFKTSRGILFVKLPSGRELAYYKAKAVPGKFGSYQLRYEGMDQTTKRWQHVETYGGKLVENIVQAIARDCLAEAMLRLERTYIAMSVHDEVVIDADGITDPEKVSALMGAPIPWAPGLDLPADTDVSFFYHKQD
jgi:DNA polymerase